MELQAKSVRVVDEDIEKSSSEELVGTMTADEETVLVTLLPPEGHQRTPSDIICIIDVSGSMGTEATLKDNKGDVESIGLT